MCHPNAAQAKNNCLLGKIQENLDKRQYIVLRYLGLSNIRKVIHEFSECVTIQKGVLFNPPPLYSDTS